MNGLILRPVALAISSSTGCQFFSSEAAGAVGRIEKVSSPGASADGSRLQAASPRAAAPDRPRWRRVIMPALLPQTRLRTRARRYPPAARGPALLLGRH